MILKISAENGASSLDGRSTSLRASGHGTDDGGHIGRRREKVDDRIEQRLHALVLERGSDENGHELRLDRGLAKIAEEDLVLGERLTLEVFLHQLIVGFTRRLDHLLTRLTSLVGQLGRNLGDLELGAQGLIPV